MISILSNGVFSDSLGPQASDELVQRENETHVMDATTKLLTEVPSGPDGGPVYGRQEILKLRMVILHFLQSVIRMNTGTSLVAHHPGALSGLVGAIHDEVNQVYNFFQDIADRFVRPTSLIAFFLAVGFRALTL